MYFLGDLFRWYQKWVSMSKKAHTLEDVSHLISKLEAAKDMDELVSKRE
jgi:hypothetical protein